MKILIVLSFLLGLVLLVSCLDSLPQQTSFIYVNSLQSPAVVPIRVIHIWIDINFGAADLVSMEDALNQWSYALHGYFEFKIESTSFDMEDDVLRRVASGDGWVFLKIDSTNEMVGHQDHGKSKVLAFTEKIGGSHLYVVRDRIKNEQMTGIIMHEIGHLLGAEHRSEEDNLMYPAFRINNSRCIDKLTLEQVAHAQRLSMAGLNYCVYIAGDKVKEN